MGLVSSGFTQTFPPKPKFSVNDIPDLSGKVVLVTGGNAGIGLEILRPPRLLQACLLHNATVYLACRNLEKTQKAINKLGELTGKEALFHHMDLADLKAVKRSGEGFLQKEQPLHVLFNNAGVMMCPIELTTADGYDMTVETNLLGHFYFTKLLLPALIAGAQSSHDKKARVVNLSSFGHELVNKFNYETYVDGPARRKGSPGTLYFESKLSSRYSGNRSLYVAELARRYGGDGIVSIAVNPGNIKSELQRHLGWFEKNVIVGPMLHPASEGALTSLYGGVSEAGAGLNGKYLISFARVETAMKVALDPKNGAELWAWMERRLVVKQLE